MIDIHETFSGVVGKVPSLEGKRDCLTKMEERTDLSDAVKEKTLRRNPAQFYRLSVPQLTPAGA
jgi:hypothetical protein